MDLARVMVQARDRVSGLSERVSEAHPPGVCWRVLTAVPFSQSFPANETNDRDTYNSGSSKRMSSEYNILFAFNWLL